MKDIREIFDDGELTRDNVLDRIEAAGLVLLEATEGGYIPASRLEEERVGHRAEMARERAEGVLKLELMRVGARNLGVAAAAVGLDGIIDCDGDMASAAMEKVAALKASDPYMFASPAEVVSTGAPHGGAMTDPDRMSDSEYYRYRSSKA